ncbi:alginate O-acetyltransferase [Pseudomonas sp. JQ170]|uniref:alginate O-acetyltransferase n=1 Tax=unclassified Pseudomonas TaxID=196821 RepID=UPI002656F4AA|nr:MULTISPECIES: alginate O-acetyltransferase [unclassified Pseudomonas]MDN7139897.1 alginate O-acetyltransferase [Pseudomonas sp. JQ170]WRO73651.1 alginate O-acetyltransferase [Pseudomonas sp. 170C]
MSRFAQAWRMSAAVATLFASSLSLAAEAPQYAIERCCQICPQALQDSSYPGDLGDFRQLVQGQEDWLFRSKIDFMTNIGTTPEGFKLLEDLRDALKARGVELVMVYLPPRGLLVTEMLRPQDRSSFNAELSRKNYLATIEHLRGLGIRVPDLSALLAHPAEVRSKFFFKRDNHWTPQGAELAAQLLAAELSKSDVFMGIARKEFATRTEGNLYKVGSLNQAFGKICGSGYANEYFTRAVTEPKEESAELFGDTETPDVVLVGTSFSSAQYNFDGFLKQYARVDVDNRSVTGGGFHSAMLQYLGSQDFQHKPPKVLIWEVNSYYDLAMATFYRQVMPLLDNGCRNVAATLGQKMALRPGKNEVLVNTGVKPIRSEDSVVEIQFSKPVINELRSTIWYMTGSRENLLISRAREVEPNGRFVFRLREDAEWAGQTLLSLEIDMPADMPQGLQVEAKICRRADKPENVMQAKAN